MKTIYFTASIRDGLYRRSERTFKLQVDDEADDDEIEECCREEILNNLLEWTWARTKEDLP